MSDTKTKEVVFVEKCGCDPDDDGDRMVLDVPEDEDPREWFCEKFGRYPTFCYTKGR